MHKPHNFYPSNATVAKATQAQIRQLRARIALHTSAFDFAYDIAPEVQWPARHTQPSPSQQVFARQALGDQIVVDAQLHLTSEEQLNRPLYPYGWTIGHSAIRLTRRAETDMQLASLHYQMYSSGHTDFSAELSHMDNSEARNVIGHTWERLALEAIDVPHEATLHLANQQVGPMQVQALGTYIMGLLRAA